MRIDMIEETYKIKDYQDTLVALAEMRGGFRAGLAVSKSRSEREMIEYILQITESFEFLIKSLPPAGTYQKIS